MVRVEIHSEKCYGMWMIMKRDGEKKNESVGIKWGTYELKILDLIDETIIKIEVRKFYKTTKSIKAGFEPRLPVWG
jgi:hypothetical protein